MQELGAANQGELETRSDRGDFEMCDDTSADSDEGDGGDEETTSRLRCWPWKVEEEKEKTMVVGRVPFSSRGVV